MRLAQVIVAVFAAGALTGCGADTVPQSKLSELVLTAADLPAGFERFDYGAQQRLDNGGLRADPTRYGRKGGWKARFHRPGDTTTKGPLVVESRADLFSKADGAKRDLLAYGETFKDAPNARPVEVQQVGDGARAITQLQPGGVAVRSYTVAWRDRNVSASVTVNGFDGHVSLADAVGSPDPGGPDSESLINPCHESHGVVGCSTLRRSLRPGAVNHGKEESVKRLLALLLGAAGIVAAAVLFTGSAAANQETIGEDGAETVLYSGVLDFRDTPAGTGLTECPQAGLKDKSPKPLDSRAIDEVERISSGGNDIRANQDYSCMPQDETAIDNNPNEPRNYVAGANDYRLGWGTSGFYATTDNGHTWYDGITPFPSTPNGDNLDGGGDPVVVFDRAGIAYYAQINFNRTDDTSGVWVNRSTNGGFTWTRPCVAIPISASPELAVCGGVGDVRQPGDGTVGYIQDNDSSLNGSVDAFDKEWLTAGPRPAGVGPVCFTPVTRTPTACDSDVVGVDRLYVTYSLFSETGSAEIYLSYSDDQARSWSPPQFISGSSPLCAPSWKPDTRCSDSQGSEPTVNPSTGQLWVGFLNGDTEDEDQYLVVTSTDGGQTFSPPSRVDAIYDINEPRGVNGRADCVARGQGSTRVDLTNTCFRADPIMNAIVADKRGGAFADDVYVVLADNRNGTIRNSNNDVFFYKSTDGGVTWIGPTRVNNDNSTTPADRDCGRNPGSIVGNSSACPAEGTGNDQFFPFVSIDQKGNLNVSFHDRRLDTSSPVGSGAWPTSKTEVGNYLVWYWGAQCQITSTATVSGGTSIPRDAGQCVAHEAVVDPSSVIGPDPGAGPVPGNGQNSSTLPFHNFQVSDDAVELRLHVPGRAVRGRLQRQHRRAADPNGDEKTDRTAAFWTDARNGRGSGTPPRRSRAATRSASSRMSSSTPTARRTAVRTASPAGPTTRSS